MRAFLPLLPVVALVVAQPAVAQETFDQIEALAPKGAIPQGFSIKQVRVVKLQSVELEYVAFNEIPWLTNNESQRVLLPAWTTTEQPYAMRDFEGVTVMYGLVKVETLPLAVGRWQYMEPLGLQKRTVMGLHLSMSLGAIRSQ